MKISLEEAALLLKQGKVVALPTETVYGLAASLSSTEAIENVFSLKGRPSQNPLIIHVAAWEQILSFISELPPFAKELADRFWPGPLTLVLPIKPELIPEKVRANLLTAAFRVPNHSLARAVLQKTGPLVAPSANLSGSPSSTIPEHIETDFGPEFPVLDGGHCEKGLESTILGFHDGRWKIYRLGALSPNEFASTLGYEPEIVNLSNGEKPLCPGQLFKHYSPKAKLNLTNHLENAPFVIGFTDRSYPGKQGFFWGHSDDPEEVGRNFYETLRKLDEQGIKEAWVDSRFPSEGLWITLKERLIKAAYTYPL